MIRHNQDNHEEILNNKNEDKDEEEADNLALKESNEDYCLNENEENQGDLEKQEINEKEVQNLSHKHYENTTTEQENQHQHAESYAQSYSRSLSTTVSANKPRTTLKNRNCTEGYEDEVLTQGGKSSKSIREQFEEQQKRSQGREKGQAFKGDDDDNKKKNLNLGGYVKKFQEKDVEELYFIAGEVYRMISSDKLFKTLQAEETSSQFLHLRVQEILKDNFVQQIRYALKEIQLQLNVQVEENCVLIDSKIELEDSQKFMEQQLVIENQKVRQLEGIILEERANTEKIIMKYEREHERVLDLERQLEKFSSEIVLKQDQVESLKLQLEKAKLNAVEEQGRFRDEYQILKERLQNENNETNKQLEREMNLMKQLRKKEKNMYEKIIQERHSNAAISQSSQASVIAQNSDFAGKLAEAGQYAGSLQREIQGLQQRLLEVQELGVVNVKAVKANCRAEIAEAKRAVEKIEISFSQLQKEHELLKQQKTIDERILTERQMTEQTAQRELLNELEKERSILQKLTVKDEEIGKKHLVVEDKLKLCEDDKMKLNSQLLEQLTKIKKIEQREGEMKAKMQKKIDSLLLENKKKTEELQFVSQTILEIQHELQTCREVNKLCEERLREREEMEMFAKGLWERAENLERLLSQAKEKDELESAELKRYYEGEILKVRDYVNVLKNERLDGMRNNNNGSLIELLKETQQELQNSENQVILLQAQLWELKRTSYNNKSELDSKQERTASFSRELIARESIQHGEISEASILFGLEEAQQQFLGIVQIANKKHADISGRLKSEYRAEKKQEDKQNKGSLKNELTEKLMAERKKLYYEINSAISVFREEIAMHESAAVKTNNLTELVGITLARHREILQQIELKTHNQVDPPQQAQKLFTNA